MNIKMTIKTFAAAVTASAVIASGAFADRKIATSVGDVTILSSGAQRPAASGETLAAGDKIKTAAASRVEILDGESKVWLRENSEMEITQSPQKESIFSLLAGKLRAKVKLMQGAKFHVKTPVSVASVRGTDFAMDSAGQLLVFEGAVDFGDLAMAAPSVVEAGMLARLDEAGAIQKETLSAEQLQQYQKEWQDAISPALEQGKVPAEAEKKDEQAEAKKEMATDLAEMRREIREMVREIRNDIVATRDLTNEIKQADIASGRTLRDRFGNLVRVEQQLLRPSDDIIQVVNITKRDSYVYNGFFKNSYSGLATSRVDIMDAQLTFSEAIPSDITKWPQFFSDRKDGGNEIKINKTYISMGNRTDKIEMIANRKTVTEDETYTYWVQEQVNNPQGGTTWVSVQKTGTRTVTRDKMEGSTKINGWASNDDDYNSRLEGAAFPDGDNDEGIKDFAMWAKSPEMRYSMAGHPDKYLSVWTEFYGINNSGGLLSDSSFASANTNPFNLLKEIAFQNVLFVKEVDPTKIVSGKSIEDAGVVKSDFFKGRNIDLVYTPDLIVAGATKLLTSGVDLGKLGASSSESK
ncbi:MAG: FecR domain-containing protein [Endomicrobiia bacterium]|nr:FecR domain-containing protein [Endomicrobiia bacterium]